MWEFDGAGSLFRGLNGVCSSRIERCCEANLIPFKKPRDPLGVRPIAVGETFRRMIAKVALAQALPKARGFLSPIQCPRQRE